VTRASKPVCYVGIALHPLARENLERHCEVTRDEARLAEASAAIVYTVPDAWAYSAAAENLRVIGCHTCEDHAEAWARQREISLTLARSLWRTVAEHMLALMMAAARNLTPADRAIRAGQWDNHHDLKARYSGRDFQGKTVGLWGMGKIGRQLAGILSGFDMRVLYSDLCLLPPEEERGLGVRAAPLEDLLRQSDYFCVLVPLNEGTRGALGKAQFSNMKKGCVLVNTARAGIIDEGAFREALEDGTVGAAGLDVFWEEAATQPAWLTERENVVLTPHLGGSTLECDGALVDAVIRALPQD
jgi:phosphoglycerate dehydrogenase-like enzyme